MKKKDRGMGVSRDLELLEARAHSFGKTGVVEVRCPSGISVLRVKDALKLANNIIKAAK